MTLDTYAAAKLRKIIIKKEKKAIAYARYNIFKSALKIGNYQFQVTDSFREMKGEIGAQWPDFLKRQSK